MIRILEDQVVNQIAAGEVVERPASVVKELVENALDAGARLIRVELKRGGADFIRVRDDGVGMSKTDATMSLERHATSKIRGADDLVGVRSLGFRGEAVPSMAAVSRFEILTRPAGEEVGTRVRVEGGKLDRVESAGCPAGTRITVQDLFFNLPVRKKFLRKPQTELGHCTETVVRQLLNHPEVDIELLHEGRRLVRAPVQDSLNVRAAALLGATGRQLVPAGIDTDRLSLSGLISPMGVHRGTARGSCYLYVNGRYVQDALLRRAIAEAYRGLVPRGRYPVVVLRLEIAGEDVDVNVHPAKTEVRFRRAQELARNVSDGLRSALTQHGLAEASRPSPAPQVDGRAGRSPQGRLGLQGEEQYRTAAPTPPVAPPVAPPPSPLVSTLPALAEPPQAGKSAEMERTRFLGKLDDETLVCRVNRDLWLLDRRALEEIRIRRALEEAGDSGRLPLLVPVVTETSKEAHESLLEQAQTVRELGIDLEDFGQHSIIIKGLAPALEGVCIETLLEELALISPPSRPEPHRQRLLSIIAAHAATKSLSPLSRFELGERVREVLEWDESALSSIGHCISAGDITAWLRKFRARNP